MANDNDPDGDTLTSVLVSGPAHGTLTLTNNGGFSYTPANGFIGTDTFTYQASDGLAYSTAASVTIIVNTTAVNNRPVANNDSYSTEVNTTLTVGFQEY